MGPTRNGRVGRGMGTAKTHSGRKATIPSTFSDSHNGINRSAHGREKSKEVSTFPIPFVSRVSSHPPWTGFLVTSFKPSTRWHPANTSRNLRICHPFRDIVSRNAGKISFIPYYTGHHWPRCPSTSVLEAESQDLSTIQWLAEAETQQKNFQGNQGRPRSRMVRPIAISYCSIHLWLLALGFLWSSTRPSGLQGSTHSKTSKRACAAFGSRIRKPTTP